MTDSVFPVPRTNTTGAELIAAERQRQIDVEGYTPAMDASHYRGNQLIRAALTYLNTDLDRMLYWPWPPSTFKPTRNDRVRELVKAAALIAAEIDRLQLASS